MALVSKFKKSLRIYDVSTKDSTNSETISLVSTEIPRAVLTSFVKEGKSQITKISLQV